MFTECDILRFYVLFILKIITPDTEEYSGTFFFINTLRLFCSFALFVSFFFLAEQIDAISAGFFCREISVWSCQKVGFFSAQFIAKFCQIIFLEQMCALSPIFELFESN